MTIQIEMFLSLFLVPYLIAAIPFGLVLTKTFLKTDIRNIGSGNIGATNVLRTGSKFLAILTVILDGFKPYLAYIISYEATKLMLGSLLTSMSFGLYDTYIKMYIALLAIFAHCFPIYLKFKGGKGVATVFGSLFMFSAQVEWIGINWYILPIVALGTWIGVAIISKKSSLSALVTAILIPYYVSEFNDYSGDVADHLTYLYILISAFVILRHTSNIKRLLKGEEGSIKGKKEEEIK